MDIDIIKQLIKNRMPGHMRHISNCETAERYYRNRTDILFMPRKNDDETPLHNADNRVASSFYSMLVNQKASYMFTAPPMFDVGETEANDKITKVLGDCYAKYCHNLCVDASNSGTAWIHYWANASGTLEYAPIRSEQIIPLWSNDLKQTLTAALRVYKEIDDIGRTCYIYEYWTDTMCYAYRRIGEDWEEFERLNMFTVFIDGVQMETNELKHGFGTVPFIPFRNNSLSENDLNNIKGLIDTYDKVYSGFVNDLEDIQEIIFILTGYGGTDLGEFLQNLKKYKTVKIDSDDEQQGGLSTLTIDIPIEAREKLLSMTRKSIFEQGQGIDPDPQNFGNSSGVALKYLYSLLELKSGVMETEFKLGFAQLIRAICRFYDLPCDKIIQTWTRTSVASDTELCDIAKNSVGIISNRSILEHHPWVEDADKELNRIEDEKQETELGDTYEQYGVLGSEERGERTNTSEQNR